MYETILTLCLLSQPNICREVYFPNQPCDQAKIAILQGHEAKGKSSCQSIGAGLSVTEIASGVFVHSGYVADAGPVHGGDLSNAGFIIGTQAIAVIDSGGSREFGEDLLRAIRQRSDLPIRYVVLTHMHPDHIFGASIFSELGAQVIGHEKLPRALLDRADSYIRNYGGRLGARFVGSQLPKIDLTVNDTLSLDLGNRVLDLQSWPLAHSGSDLTVLDQQSKTLFAGDLLFDHHTPALDGSLRGWQSILKELQQTEAVQIVPGHGAMVLPKDMAFAPMRRYLDVLANDTRTAIDQGQSMADAVETIAQSERPNWDLFDLFNPRNATVAFSELEWE